MFQKTYPSVAVLAEKSSDLAAIVAVIDVEPFDPAPRFGRCANRAPTALGLQHLGVSSVFYAVTPTGVEVGVPLRVGLAPVLAGAAMGRRVLVAALGDDRHGAGLAVLLLAVVRRAVGAKGLKELGVLATRAPLLAFRGLPSRVRAVAGLGVAKLAGPAIAGQAVGSGLRHVEGQGGFDLGALRALLFGEHVHLQAA